jgi:hypothetical protein
VRFGTEQRRQTFWARLVCAASALNVAGILCLNAATRAPEQLASDGFGYAGWSRGWASLLDSLGFALMMPGIFFATTVFLGAHGLAWSERATRAVWYATGYGINLLTVWRVGVAWRAARETGRS